MSTVHVVYNGESKDLEFDTVFSTERLAAIGIADGTEVSASTVSQENVRTALAQHFDVGLSEFSDHYVEINPNGNITVRPNATFG